MPSRNILGCLLRTVSCGHACAISMRVIAISRMGFGILSNGEGGRPTVPDAEAFAVDEDQSLCVGLFLGETFVEGDGWRLLGRYAAQRYEALRNTAL